MGDGCRSTYVGYLLFGSEANRGVINDVLWSRFEDLMSNSDDRLYNGFMSMNRPNDLLKRYIED